MKTIIGLILILAGIALGIYLGIWVMFIGGIVGIIECVRAEELVALDVAINVAKVVFAAFVGWLSAFLLIIPGKLMLD